MVNCPSKCGGESKKLELTAELITKYKGFHCRWEMDGWNRSTGVGGFNSPLKREPAMLKTLESFSYMVYFAFLIVVSKREG